MKPLRFRTRVVVAFLAAAAVTLGVAYVGFRYEFELGLVRSQRPILRRRARRVARRYWQGETAKPSDAPRHRRDIGTVTFDPDGTLLEDHPATEDPISVPPELVAKAAGRPGSSTTETLPCPHGRFVRAFAELYEPGEHAPAGATPVVVVAYRSLDAIQDQAAAEMNEAISKVAPLTIVICITAAWLLARGLTRPLARVAEDASRASLAGTSEDVHGSGAGDELDALADVLNRTFARLREAYERQSRFTSDAAHELRTPVTAILGRTEVALRRDRSDEEYRAALADVHDVAARAAGTVEGLLHLARLDAGEAIASQDVDLGELASGVVEARRAALDDARSLRLSAADGPCHVAGDPVLLRIAVRNLVDNALTHGASERGVDVRLRREGGRVLLAVHDHGPGIPAQHLDRVFDRMFRVDAARGRRNGGAGLGLAIVRAVAEAHGGSVEATSSSTGTTVTLSLPAAG